MKLIRIRNRVINLGQIAYTEYLPAEQEGTQVQAVGGPTGRANPIYSHPPRPAVYLIKFSGGTELKVTGGDADFFMTEIDRQINAQ